MLVADHARTIKLNRQSSLSETSKGSEHASSNSQPRSNILSSVETAARDEKINITLKTQISSSMGNEIPYSQVSSSCTFPVPQSVYTSTYEHLKLKGKEANQSSATDFGNNPMEQDPHPNEEEGPIDMSMKKRSESPPPSPPYRYTPLTLTTHENILPKSPQESTNNSSENTTTRNSPPVQQILVPGNHHIAPPPSYSAATRPPPPPYPSSPSPPIASSTNQISQNSIKREPPPSYGSTFPSPPNKNSSITSSRIDYHSRHDKYPVCDSTRQDDRKIREVTIITGNYYFSFLKRIQYLFLILIVCYITNI